MQLQKEKIDCVCFEIVIIKRGLKRNEKRRRKEKPPPRAEAELFEGKTFSFEFQFTV